MISFERKYCDRTFPFYFYFSHFGEISQLGTPKKKNAAAHKWADFFSSPTKWFYPLLLIWTFSSSEVTRGFSGGPDHHQVVLCTSSYMDLLKLRSYVLFFWWTGSTTKWVCTRLFLYGPSLDPLVKKERASERAKQTHSRDVHREEPVQGWCVERLLLPQSVCWSAPLRL
jgi:hypothetical protein